MYFITAYCQIRNQLVKTNGTNIPVNIDSEDFPSRLYETLRLDYPKFYKMDRQSQLGLLASEVVLRACPIVDYPAEEVTTLLANQHASLDTDMRYSDTMINAPSPSLFVYTLPNIVAGEICIRQKIKGENIFLISDGFDVDMMFEQVEMLLQQTGVKACLAGWINVLREQHDVLLYLVENRKRGLSLEHTRATIRKLYEA